MNNSSVFVSARIS